MPTQKSRVEILKIHAKNKPLADDVDLKKVARSTPGFSGADLYNLLNEASVYAGRDKRKKVSMEDIDRARDKVMMGGRAAEDLIFETSTCGAKDDLKQAAKLSRKMVLEWGMSERFQHISIGSEEEEVFPGRDMSRQREYSDSTAREIDEEVQKITKGAFDRALNTLKEHRDVLEKVTEMLLEQEEIPVNKLINFLMATAKKSKSKKDSSQKFLFDCSFTEDSNSNVSALISTTCYSKPPRHSNRPPLVQQH